MRNELTWGEGGIYKRKNGGFFKIYIFLGDKKNTGLLDLNALIFGPLDLNDQLRSNGEMIWIVDLQ